MKLTWKATAAILIALCGFLAYAGYFEDDVLVRVPATAAPIPAHRHLAAVFFSGDFGYRVGMGRKIGNRLAADGIPVIAVNSIGYFRSHRTVAEVTALTSDAIRQALAYGHADQVVLIGHSFGADALQAGLVQLPQGLRAKVRAVVLIVPTRVLFLRVSPVEMLDLGEPDGQVLPSLTKLTWAPLTCIYGTDESDSPCPQLFFPNVHLEALPGGHALDWDTGKIHSVLMNAIESATPRKVTKDSAFDNPAARLRTAEPEHR